MRFLVLFTLLLSQTWSRAHADSTLDVQLGTRATHINEPTGIENRLQGRIRIGFVVDVAGIVEIVGLADSGNNFNSPWVNVYSDAPVVEQQKLLAFRNIYLRKMIGPATIKFGSFNPDPQVGSAGQTTSGYFDGLQVKVNTQVGAFKVIAGSLGNFNQSNLFERKFLGNFIEIEMSHTFFESLLTKTAIQNYNGNFYIQEKLQLDLKLVGDRVLKIFANALYDIERQAFNYEVGTEFDVLKMIFKKYENRVNLKLYFVNMNSNIPDRTQMIPSFHSHGPLVVSHISGNIDKNGLISWFIRGAAGPDSYRVDAGLQFRMPQLKAKTNAPSPSEQDSLDNSNLLSE